MAAVWTSPPRIIDPRQRRAGWGEAQDEASARRVARHLDHVHDAAELEAARRVGRDEAREASALLRARAAERAATLADAARREAVGALMGTREQLRHADRHPRQHAVGLDSPPRAGPPPLHAALAASAMSALGAIEQLRAPLDAFTASALRVNTPGGGTDTARAERAFDALVRAVRAALDAAASGEPPAAPSARGPIDARHLALAGRLGRARRTAEALGTWRAAAATTGEADAYEALERVRQRLARAVRAPDE
jgi:hypothetical protein